MRSLKHPFGDERGQLPVRGQARVTMVVIASGVMLNLRRIWRYRQAERETARKNLWQPRSTPVPAIFGPRWPAVLAHWWSQVRCGWGLPTPAFSC